MLDTTNPMFLMGALVAIASAGFFSLRYFRPTASREYDVVFAIVGFIYAVTLMWEGWRLIPLLAFAQLLLVGTSAFFAVESFRLRLQLTERARENVGGVGPSRRGPRGFTKTYRPEEYDTRRKVGSRSVRNRMRDADGDDETPRRRKLRSANGSRPRLASGGETRRPSRRPRPSRPATRDRYEGEEGYEGEESASYGGDRQQDDYRETQRPSRRPRRVRNSREDFDPRDEFDSPGNIRDLDSRDEFSSGSTYDPDEFVDDSLNEDSFPDEPRITRRPRRSSPSAPRRRPPRMPDNIVDEREESSSVRSLDIDDYDGEYGNEYSGYDESY